MATDYYLQDYTLTVDPDDYIAVIASKGTASLEDLAQTMVQQDSRYTPEEIQAFLDEIRQAALALLEQGFRVTGPLALVAPNIQGLFYGEEDIYDPRRHQAILMATAEPQFEREWQANAKFRKVRTRPSVPASSLGALQEGRPTIV